jgi:cardiolipin synthase
MTEVFEADMKKSHLLTREEIKKQGRILRTLQSFSRMLSPIL